RCLRSTLFPYTTLFRSWTRWSAEHQSIKRARAWLHDLPQDQQAALRARQNFFCYVQWIAHQQWREIKSCAEDREVALMGDIPFGDRKSTRLNSSHVSIS